MLLLRDGRRSRPPVAPRAPALGASHHKLIAYGVAWTCWCWSFWGMDQDRDRDHDHDHDQDQDQDRDRDQAPYLASAMSIPRRRCAAARTSFARLSAMAPNARAKSMAATTSQRLLRAIVK